MPSQPLHADVSDATAQGSTEILDLTNSHLQSLAEVHIDQGLKHLDLTANRLESLDLRILALTGERAQAAWLSESVTACSRHLAQLERTQIYKASRGGGYV